MKALVGTFNLQHFSLIMKTLPKVHLHLLRCISSVSRNLSTAGRHGEYQGLDCSCGLDLGPSLGPAVYAASGDAAAAVPASARGSGTTFPGGGDTGLYTGHSCRPPLSLLPGSLTAHQHNHGEGPY